MKNLKITTKEIENMSEQTLGELIRIERINKPLTQVEFAKLLNVSQAAVSGIESNRRRPSVGLMERIAKILNVPVPVLTGRPSIYTTVVRNLERLEPEELEAINNLINVMKKKCPNCGSPCICGVVT